jgi:hypothetical protein
MWALTQFGWLLIEAHPYGSEDRITHAPVEPAIISEQTGGPIGVRSRSQKATVQAVEKPPEDPGKNLRAKATSKRKRG